MAGGRVLTVLVVRYAFDVLIALQELLTNGSDVSDLQVVEGAAVRTAAPVGEEQTLGEHLADVVALDGVCGDREEGRGRGHCLSALAAGACVRSPRLHPRQLDPSAGFCQVPRWGQVTETIQISSGVNPAVCTAAAIRQPSY